MVDAIFIVPVLLIYAVISYIVFKKRNISRIKYFIFLCMAIYLSAVVAVTMFPITIDKRLIEETIASGYSSAMYNLIPFKTILEMASDSNFQMSGLKNIGGNILLLMPLGFGVPLIWKKYNCFRKSIVIGLLSTISIELLQLLISMIIGYQYKSFDIDDIILNTIGFTIGFIIYKSFNKLRNKIDINI